MSALGREETALPWTWIDGVPWHFASYAVGFRGRLGVSAPGRLLNLDRRRPLFRQQGFTSKGVLQTRAAKRIQALRILRRFRWPAPKALLSCRSTPFSSSVTMLRPLSANRRKA